MSKQLIPAYNFELPNGWKASTLEELINFDGVFKDGDWVESKDQDPNGNVRLIQLADIGDGKYKNKSARFLTKEKALKLNCTFLKKGDVLIARMPDPLGRACIFQGDVKDAVTVVDVCVIRTGTNEINHKWLVYWVNSPSFRNTISSLQSGTTRKRISRKNLAKISFPVPPPEQQKQIVAKIEQLFSHIDAGIEALNTAKQRLKQYRQSVLKAAVTGELTKEWREANKDKLEPASKVLLKIEEVRNNWIEEQIQEGNKEASRLRNKLKKHLFDELDSSIIPNEWVSVSLTKLCLLVVDCHNKTAPYVEEGIPLIRTSNIKEGAINFHKKMKYVTQETYDFWSRRCPPNTGDIFLTREAPMGESAIVPKTPKVCMGQRMMLLRVIHELTDVEYLHFAIMEPLFQKRIHKFKVGMGVQHLRVGDVEKLVIAMPSLEEQKVIVSKTNDKLELINRLDKEIDMQLLKASKNKQSILVSAFSGRLVNE